MRRLQLPTARRPESARQQLIAFLCELRALNVQPARQAAIEVELRRDFELGWPEPAGARR